MGTNPAPIPETIEETAPQAITRNETYELMVIIPATLSDEELPSNLSKVTDLLAKHGMKITKEDDLGKRKLAFPIKHVRQGFYRVFELEGPASNVKKLDVDLRLMPDVLRYLMTVRKVKSAAQLEAETALRERIQAKRLAVEERAVAERQQKTLEEQQKKEGKAAAQPTRQVTKEELDKKLEELLTDDTIGQ